MLKANVKYLVLLLILPILSIFGIVVLNSSGNNLLTILMFLLVIFISALFFFKGSQLFSLYPLALFTIGLSVLLSASLVNTFYHVHGYDMFGEYNVYQMTLQSQHWTVLHLPSSNPPTTSSLTAYSSCLSITILPTIITLLTGYNGPMIFLLVFPVILSFSLPIVYFLLCKRIGEKYAFLSTLLMLNFTYVLEISTLARQEIALFFLALAAYLMFSEKGSKRLRYSLLIIFSFGIIISHYATGYAFIAALLVLAVASHFFGETTKRRQQIRIGFLTFLLVFCIGLLWFIVVTGGPFTQMVGSTVSTVNGIKNFLSASRNLAPIGFTTNYPFGYTLVQNFVSYGVQFFLFIGVLWCALSYKKSGEQKTSIEKHVVLLGLSFFVALALYTILPSISVAFGTNRLYITLFPFLLFFFADGVSWFFRRLTVRSKKPVGIVMVLFVALQILISSGLMALAFGYPLPQIVSLPETVQKDGPSAFTHYTSNNEISMNLWFSHYYNNSKIVFADEYEILRLWSYGNIVQVNTLTGDEHQLAVQQGYVLLRYENVVYNTIDGRDILQANTTQLNSDLCLGTDRIYDNNGTLIYCLG